MLTYDLAVTEVHSRQETASWDKDPDSTGHNNETLFIILSTGEHPHVHTYYRLQYKVSDRVRTISMTPARTSSSSSIKCKFSPPVMMY